MIPYIRSAMKLAIITAIADMKKIAWRTGMSLKPMERKVQSPSPGHLKTVSVMMAPPRIEAKARATDVMVGREDGEEEKPHPECWKGEGGQGGEYGRGIDCSASLMSAQYAQPDAYHYGEQGGYS